MKVFSHSGIGFGIGAFLLYANTYSCINVLPGCYLLYLCIGYLVVKSILLGNIIQTLSLLLECDSDGTKPIVLI